MEKLRGTSLESHADAILALVRPSIGFEYARAAERTLPVGTSKCGGRPDMPEGTEWPTHAGDPLTFLAQFNLADLHTSPVARDLPATGLLALFCLYDYGEEFADGNWRLLYFPDASELIRHEQHPNMPDDYVAPSVRLSFTEEQTLPEPESVWAKELVRRVLQTNECQVDYSNLRDAVGRNMDMLLGHPYTFEGDVLGKKTVRHLFTISENAITEWWPEDNIMYVTITESALKKAQFDRAKATLQCV
jgi:uncharacterized protein YwqG